MAEQGEVFAGPGAPAPFRDAAKYAAKYGGTPNDWVKMRSSSWEANGYKFETHWVENLATGQRLDFKTVPSWTRLPASE